MTGLGTKESPFMIQTVDDFLSMGETGSSTAYYELASDINMDGDGNRRLQENPKIILNCVSIEGNGHKIRNMIVMRPNEKYSIFSPAEGVENVTITNLGFENMNLSGHSVSIFSGDNFRIRLYRCSFTMFVKTNATSNDLSYGTLINYSDATKMMCDSCTFILRSNCSDVSTSFIAGTRDNNTYVRNCQLKFDTTLHGNVTTASSSGCIFKNIEVTNVFVEGHARVLKRSSDQDSYFPVTDNNCRVSNVLVMISVTNINKISMGGTFLSSCVYNLDSAGDAKYVPPNTAATLSPKLYGLTDSECRNAEKLREIGFDFEEA